MTGPPIRVVTYNTHGCIGADGRYAPGRVADLLVGLDADIIGLQEVDNRRPRTDGAHQFDYLCRATGYRGIPGPNIVDHRGDFGNALLTRLPVRAVRHIDLTVRRREPRGAIDADLAGPAGPLRAIVTHLGLGPRERRTQIRRLMGVFGDMPPDGRPTLLLGDFNEWLPGDWWLRALTQGFAAAFAGRTFPAWLPLMTLDRIYAHPEPARHAVRVHRKGLARWASDHLPLAVDLHWPARRHATAAE
jgi:endonuclease/exonuclease/phosphatase family metal-dependent hydrolase